MGKKYNTVHGHTQPHSVCRRDLGTAVGQLSSVLLVHRRVHVGGASYFTGTGCLIKRTVHCVKYNAKGSRVISVPRIEVDS